MQLLKNYKYRYGTFDKYPWFMPKHNESVLPNMVWYFATYSYTVSIEDGIGSNNTWGGWKISKIPIGYLLRKD